MNFLAHLYLSGEQPRVMVGNFIGDFVKGRSLATRFESEVVLGIELHRAIDHFTDTHKVVKKSKKRIFTKYRHYSGVIVDVFYDHFLASKWSEYHNQSLADFAQTAYNNLMSNDAILPQEVKNFLPYMVTSNWLVGYSYVDGIQKALTGMASRTPYVSHMEKAADDLREQYDAFGGDFTAFFPQLRDFCAEYLKARKAGSHGSHGSF